MLNQVVIEIGFVNRAYLKLYLVVSVCNGIVPPMILNHLYKNCKPVGYIELHSDYSTNEIGW